MYFSCEKIRRILDQFISEHQVELKSTKPQEKYPPDYPAKLAHRSAAKRRQEVFFRF